MNDTEDGLNGGRKDVEGFEHRGRSRKTRESRVESTTEETFRKSLKSTVVLGDTIGEKCDLTHDLTVYVGRVVGPSLCSDENHMGRAPAHTGLRSLTNYLLTPVRRKVVAPIPTLDSSSRRTRTVDSRPVSQRVLPPRGA